TKGRGQPAAGSGGGPVGEIGTTIQVAGAVLPPSKPRAGPAPPRRSVCAPARAASRIPRTLHEGKRIMWFRRLLRSLVPLPAAACLRGRRPAPRRLSIETLEDRALPSVGFSLGADYNPTGIQVSTLATGDFNRDGVPDLVVANSNLSTLSILLGKGDGTFAVS